jgi:hypothetical protein
VTITHSRRCTERGFNKGFDNCFSLLLWFLLGQPRSVISISYRSRAPFHSHLEGVTLFKASENRPAEQMLIDWMDPIDLRHGVYSADRPYTGTRGAD